jgi:DNA-directed RNA polymerase subunit RPC12/RpoP
MADLITLTCPSCGGQLQVTSDADRYVCQRCGNAHVIDPRERVESLTGEIKQMRLMMDIRQMEDDLAVLRKRKAKIEEMLAQQRESQRTSKFLLRTLPITVVVIFGGFGVYTAYSGDGINVVLLPAVLAAAFSVFLHLFMAWSARPTDRYKSKQLESELELGQLTQRLDSGKNTLDSLRQELQRATNRQ